MEGICHSVDSIFFFLELFFGDFSVGVSEKIEDLEHRCSDRIRGTITKGIKVIRLYGLCDLLLKGLVNSIDFSEDS